VGSVLTAKPSLLLLDEPTTGQDRARIDKMMGAIVDDCDTVVFSTHDVETAARHANRVVLLHGGRIIADGPPDEVLFDWETLETASIRPSEIHLFAALHDLTALTVESLVEVFR
jgi:energy-coupling factor transport system ATP-binding protein